MSDPMTREDPVRAAADAASAFIEADVAWTDRQYDAVGQARWNRAYATLVGAVVQYEALAASPADGAEPCTACGIELIVCMDYHPDRKCCPDCDHRPTPFQLWEQASGDRDRYIELMREHGHIIPGKRPPGEDVFGHPIPAGPMTREDPVSRLTSAIAYAIARAPVPGKTDTAHDVAARLAPLVIESGWLAASPADGAGVDVERLFRAFWESDAYWLFHNPKHQEPEERFRRMVRAAVAEYDRLAALEGASDGTP